MKIIPVIDILNGSAVRAHRGHRQSYQPLQSTLCNRGKILPLIDRLCSEFGFPLIYLCDLNAVMGNGNNDALLAQIGLRFPQLQLWFDGGFRQPADLDRSSRYAHVRNVVGSETWNTADPLPDSDPILSVDLGDEGLRDPSGICTDPGRRPDDLILMTLARVGSGSGPDITLFREWQQTAPNANWYIAGGIRDPDDVVAAGEQGAAGVLLASSLHDGKFDRHIVQALS